METLLKINASIFGENGASSRLTQLTVKGLHFARKPARPRSAQHLSDFVRAPRALISSTNC